MAHLQALRALGVCWPPLNRHPKSSPAACSQATCQPAPGWHARLPDKRTQPASQLAGGPINPLVVHWAEVAQQKRRVDRSRSLTLITAWPFDASVTETEAGTLTGTFHGQGLQVKPRRRAPSTKASLFPPLNQVKSSF